MASTSWFISRSNWTWFFNSWISDNHYWRSCWLFTVRNLILFHYKIHIIWVISYMVHFACYAPYHMDHMWSVRSLNWKDRLLWFSGRYFSQKFLESRLKSGILKMEIQKRSIQHLLVERLSTESAFMLLILISAEKINKYSKDFWAFWKTKGTPGIEPGTSRSAVECSTPELYPRRTSVIFWLI